jgi:cytochrome c-type biogenesis protein CcmF
MIPEIGHFALILAFCFAFLLATVPFIGSFKQNEAWMKLALPLSLGQCFFLMLSFLSLIHAFMENDFSVAYVARNSNSALPILYRVCAVWGGHEGSLLLWVFLLSAWVMLASFSTRRLPLKFSAEFLAITGWVSFGFLLFLLITSNPFTRLLPDYPLDGRDLNPLLQDPGFVLHPPLLYMGYVGLTLPFAWSMALLLKGNPLPREAKWLRPWVLAIFAFLTLGIALGSFWAYYELGWGGWWFWDPVENASFMPWLICIALIHTLMLNEKREIFYGWSILLSIIGFGLSLLGTFLVRSGILTSVHAFATDPKRGAYLLLFLLVVIGGALLLYALKGTRVLNIRAGKRLELFSREVLILISTVFLLVAMASILLGTLYPLIYDVLFQKKISVGFPYFNKVFTPLVIPVLLLLPLGPISQWGYNSLQKVATKISIPLGISFIASFLLPLLFQKPLSFYVILGLFLSLWLILATLNTLLDKSRKRGGIKGLSLGAWGMGFAHAGVGVILLGITLVSNYGIEQDIKMRPGQSVRLSGYDILFNDITAIEGSNYVGYQGHFLIHANQHKTNHLYPEKRIYVIPEIPLTETAIDAGFFRDIYLALGEKLEGEQVWSLRLYYQPFVRWIWFGALMVGCGGFLSAVGRRGGSRLL